MDTASLASVTATNASAANASSTAPASSSSKSSGATPAAAASSDSQIYYSSPVVTRDALTGAVITEWRDVKTGAELYQSPSEASLLYGTAQSLTTRHSSQTANAAPANKTAVSFLS